MEAQQPSGYFEGNQWRGERSERERKRERERQTERQTDRQRGKMTKVVDVREKEKEVSDIKYQPNQVNHQTVRKEEKKKGKKFTWAKRLGQHIYHRSLSPPTAST